MIDGLSLGGFIGYVNNDSDSTTTIGNTDTDDEQKSSTFAFGPRIGYAFMFSDIEAMFVIAPVQHAAFIFGPTMDYTLSGSGEYDDPNGIEADIDDIKVNTFGIQAGIVAWF